MQKKLDTTINQMNQMRKEGMQTRGSTRDDVNNQIQNQIQSFMMMFAYENQVRFSPDIPLRERTDPILPRLGLNLRAVDSMDFEAELAISGEMFEERAPDRRQAAQSQPHFLMPKLDLSFEGHNPRWWIRRFEKLFALYQILEHQNITLALAYLNDVANSWLQSWNWSQTGNNWPNFVEELCQVRR